ncbi:hypothetical protein C1N91_12735 [Curtobacterium sp. SGAir0471]|nr:hypothetical protein C1N91_12735 [Curtobacterium sp. SGAir0471]
MVFGAMQLFQDRKDRRTRAEQEARAQASGLWAWTGSYRGDVAGAGKEFGFVITNASGKPFRDVIVEVMMHGRVFDPARIMTLPPGDFFVQLYKDDTWGYATSLEEYGRVLRPYTRTDRYRVNRIVLTDASGRRWRITPEEGVTPEAPTAADSGE